MRLLGSKFELEWGCLLEEWENAPISVSRCEFKELYIDQTKFAGSPGCVIRYQSLDWCYAEDEETHIAGLRERGALVLGTNAMSDSQSGRVRAAVRDTLLWLWKFREAPEETTALWIGAGLHEILHRRESHLPTTQRDVAVAVYNAADTFFKGLPWHHLSSQTLPVTYMSIFHELHAQGAWFPSYGPESELRDLVKRLKVLAATNLGGTKLLRIVPGPEASDDSPNNLHA